MPSPIERISLQQTVDRLDGVLDAVERLGVKLGRFARYRKILALAANTLTAPASRPWLGSNENDRLFYEAACQCRQLVDAFPVWRWTTPTIATKKLKEVCSGSELPPPSPDNDHARNTLAELACAGLLHHKGFECEVTEQDADVIASLADVGSFIVEAKRPAHCGTIAKNAGKVRDQLAARRKGELLGIAVFAMDRVLGLTDGDFVLSRASDLDAVLGRNLEPHVQELQRTEHRLFPSASLGALLTTGAVFCVDPGFIVTISSLAFFCTGPEDHPVSTRLYRALKPTVDTEQRMARRQAAPSGDGLT